MTEYLPRIAAGIPGLDAVLGGGFVDGASYILQGQPGAGKTILANQIAFEALRAGRKVLYITLLAETHDRLFQSLSTLDFFDKERLGNGIVYLSVFQTLKDEGLSAVVSLLRQETRRQQATLLIFDGLLNARDRAETDIDVKTFVAEVQSQAAFVGCTVLFLTSARLADQSPEHTMVDGVIELYDELVGMRSARRLQVRKSRGSGALGGYHQFEITSSGICIYPRLESSLSHPSIPDMPSAKRISTGIEGLDELFLGGIPSGSVTLLLGSSGSGKTSLGLDFLSESSAAEPGMLFGFYETPERLLIKADALGISLREQVEQGAVYMRWQPLTENLIDKLGHRLLEEVRARGIKRLVIDALAGFERACLYSPRLIEFFAALCNELRALDVTTIVTWEKDSSAGSGAPGPELYSLIDNLVTLRQVPRRSGVTRSIALLKVRDGAFEPALHEFVIGTTGLKVAFPVDYPSNSLSISENSGL
ncbi:circadian clock protein KaiC [Devosia crocina]|uniref:non-specific serine/threonine protein kinase n=1 Tax=Devosia crocina TaxID=429728 RepID=A0A1I7NCA3_9HYPH|nr:ATPase domain-containing protein [Devosia crocina]SFV32292.1 circadian clock protein KaiC [Devosia crocina]